MSAHPPKILECRKLGYTWDKSSDKNSQANNQPLFTDFNLHLHAGEKLALAGRSGSGKTTLIKICAGLQRPSSGHLFWQSQDAYALTESERTLWRNQQIGFLDQSSQMIANLTIAENIALTLGRKLAKADKERIDHLLVQLGISHLQKKFPDQCSGGERQRAGVVRALAKNPLLLILDEPTASLDATSAHQVLSLLDTQIEQGTALLVSSHDSLVNDWVDRSLSIGQAMSHPSGGAS